MNEQIREVWIKAAREDSDPDNWDTQEQFIERFAELIVRECANRASWAQDTNEQDIGGEVLKHFGVEE
jgi:hypothetical protein